MRLRAGEAGADQIARAEAALAPGGVHVWVFDSSPERATSVRGLLAPEELDRAARVRVERRDRFVAVRGTLRTLLAAYTGTPARELRIAYGRHGKPHLVDSPIAFNVSHSGSLAAIAIASGRDVGVDVELRRPRKRLALLARAVLSGTEREWFAALPEDERLAGFLDAWSAKEAIAKLVGRGLTLPFRALDPHAPPVPCSVERLPVGAGYSGALAVGAEGASR
jgi:4'-phosphopantetheinyl transferase